MKNITRNGIFLGLGLLATSPFIATPASAAPHHDRGHGHKQVVKKTVVKRTVVRHPAAKRAFNEQRTIQGTVTKNLDGNDFLLRLSNGRTHRVIVPSGEPRGLSRGDVVRATGLFSSSEFRATHATILRNR